MYKFNAVEIGSGALYLFIYDDNGNLVHYCDNFEYGEPGELADCVNVLLGGSAVDLDDWGWGSLESDLPENLHEWYCKEWSNSDIWDDSGTHIIADQDGIYYDEMGPSGHRAFRKEEVLPYSREYSVCQECGKRFPYDGWNICDRCADVLIPEAEAFIEETKKLSTHKKQKEN